MATPGPTADPELIADYACITGEGPLWHEDEARLYWSDIPNGLLFRYDPVTGDHERVYDGAVVGGYTIEADGALLLFGARGSVRRWRDGELTTVIDEIVAERGTRFNDVIADPEGRVFCGTMPDGDRPGRLYRLDLDGSVTVVLEDAGLSNGMGFTPDLTAMYHTDTAKGTITRFDYDRGSGDLTNGQIVVTIPGDAGFPDGIAVDTNGDLWSARWDGGALYQYSSAGDELQRVLFPARKVSSVTFAGPDYRDAYVTTAGGDNKAEEGSGAGALFRVDLGVQGRAPFRSRIALQ